MTEATYRYIETANPAEELIDVTTAPTDGLTITSRKFDVPMIQAVSWAESPSSGGLDTDNIYEKSVSTNIITLGVNGTGRKCRITLVRKTIDTIA